MYLVSLTLMIQYSLVKISKWRYQKSNFTIIVIINFRVQTIKVHVSFVRKTSLFWIRKWKSELETDNRNLCHISCSDGCPYGLYAQITLLSDWQGGLSRIPYIRNQNTNCILCTQNWTWSHCFYEGFCE